MLAYVNRLFYEQYKQWKSDLHQYFETFDDPHVALEEGCPKEFEGREDNWAWLCSHFQELGYVVFFYIKFKIIICFLLMFIDFFYNSIKF